MHIVISFELLDPGRKLTFAVDAPLNPNKQTKKNFLTCTSVQLLFEFRLSRPRSAADTVCRPQEESWEAHQKHLMNFIRTSGKPAIYFLPKVAHPNSDALLERSQVELTSE